MHNKRCSVGLLHPRLHQCTLNSVLCTLYPSIHGYISVHCTLQCTVGTHGRPISVRVMSVYTLQSVGLSQSRLRQCSVHCIVYSGNTHWRPVSVKVTPPPVHSIPQGLVSCKARPRSWSHSRSYKLQGSAVSGKYVKLVNFLNFFSGWFFTKLYYLFWVDIEDPIVLLNMKFIIWISRIQGPEIALFNPFRI